MRILITGSRDWVNKSVVFDALLNVVKQEAEVTVVHGGADGADAIAERWAQHFLWNVEPHPANWASCGSGCGPSHWRYRNGVPYCPRSGFIRNAHMVALGADVCLAFIRNESNGATMTAKLAERAGIPVHRYIQNDEM